MNDITFVCPVCKKVVLEGLSDGEGEKQIIDFICGVCAGRVRETEIIRPPFLNAPADSLTELV